jgi:hypothetical protein
VGQLLWPQGEEKGFLLMGTRPFVSFWLPCTKCGRTKGMEMRLWTKRGLFTGFGTVYREKEILPRGLVSVQTCLPLIAECSGRYVLVIFVSVLDAELIFEFLGN